MGWKTYFELTESDIKSMYENGKKWGDWTPRPFVIGTTTHYGIGYEFTAPGKLVLSPPVDHMVGYKTRITVEGYVLSNVNYNWYVVVYIGFKTDGDFAKLETDGTLAGAPIGVPKSPTGQLVGSYFTVVFEQENNVVRIRADSTEYAPVKFLGTLARFVLGLETREYVPASGESSQVPMEPGSVIVAITHIKAEYYDWIEDLIANFIKIMNIMMWVMIGVMFVVMLIRAFRTEKGGE